MTGLTWVLRPTCHNSLRLGPLSPAARPRPSPSCPRKRPSKRLGTKRRCTRARSKGKSAQPLPCLHTRGPTRPSLSSTASPASPSAWGAHKRHRTCCCPAQRGYVCSVAETGYRRPATRDHHGAALRDGLANRSGHRSPRSGNREDLLARRRSPEFSRHLGADREQVDVSRHLGADGEQLDVLPWFFRRTAHTRSSLSCVRVHVARSATYCSLALACGAGTSSHLMIRR